MRHLKDGGAYFIVRGIPHMKFQNFVILSCQIMIIATICGSRPSKICKRLRSTNFTWSILEYLDPYDIQLYFHFFVFFLFL